MRQTAEGVPLTRSRHDLVDGEMTPRQAQVVKMFVSGMTFREVAGQLGLSPGTINPMLKQAARRVGAPGIARDKLKPYVKESS